MEDKPTLSEEQRMARRKTLAKEIEELNTKVGNPSDYFTSDKQPYRNSPEYLKDQELLKGKLCEYHTLTPKIVGPHLRMKSNLSFTDGRYILKYNYKVGKWDLYDGTDFLTRDVVFNAEGTEATMTVPVQNSTTHGETWHYIYSMKVLPNEDPILKKRVEPRCTIADEGEAMVKRPDNSFMSSMGYVVDANTGTWRRQTPLEYEAKTKQTLAKPESKRGLGGFFRGKSK